MLLLDPQPPDAFFKAVGERKKERKALKGGHDTATFFYYKMIHIRALLEDEREVSSSLLL